MGNEEGSSGPQSSRKSLAHTILNLDSNVAKQNALQHILNGLRILYARDTVIAALQSHAKPHKTTGKAYTFTQANNVYKK